MKYMIPLLVIGLIITLIVTTKTDEEKKRDRDLEIARQKSAENDIKDKAIINAKNILLTRHLKISLQSDLDAWAKEDENLSGRAATQDFVLTLKQRVELYSQTLLKSRDSFSNKEVATLHNKLLTSIRTTLSRVFIAARKDYANTTKNKLWEEDIDVHISGDTKTITLIGYHFAANKIVMETMKAMRDITTGLKFKRVVFMIYKNSRSTYYDLSPTKDSYIEGYDK